jgi:hypothetical protein
MSIVFDDNYKNQICCRITVRIGEAVKNNELSEDELPEVCTYVLVAFEDMKTYEDLNDLLFKLTARWPFFEDVTADESKLNSTVSSIENMFNRQPQNLPAGV